MTVHHHLHKFNKMHITQTLQYTVNSHSNRGFSLVEVMVAMVVFSIGLLGLAGLQSLGISNNQTAYLRSIAMQQAYNMSDRMRDNITAVNAGNYNAITTTIPSSFTNCITNSCTTTQLSVFDAFEWNTTNAEQLPEGRGSVTRDGDQFIICVMWNELKVAGATEPDCTGDTAYNPTTEYKFYALRVEL